MIKKLLFFLAVPFCLIGCSIGEVEENKSGYLLFPGYFYPAEDDWKSVFSVSSDVLKVVVINPCGGPFDCGGNIDNNYKELIKALNDNGNIPIGYVHTNYGNRDISEVEFDIDTWLEEYPGIKGFFIDEVPNTADGFEYYKSIVSYITDWSEINGQPYFIVLNPGTKVDDIYYSIADLIVIFENSFSSFTDSSCYSNYPEKSACVVYNAAESEMEKVISVSNVKYFYITDDSLPFPYDSLPSYFFKEIELLK